MQRPPFLRSNFDDLGYQSLFRFIFLFFFLLLILIFDSLLFYFHLLDFYLFNFDFFSIIHLLDIGRLLLFFFFLLLFNDVCLIILPTHFPDILSNAFVHLWPVTLAAQKSISDSFNNLLIFRKLSRLQSLFNVAHQILQIIDQLNVESEVPKQDELLWRLRERLLVRYRWRSKFLYLFLHFLLKN